MLIKMITTMAGPNISATSGQVVDVDKKIALTLIAGGFASPVKTTGVAVPAASNPENENASLNRGGVLARDIPVGGNKK